MNNWDAIRAHYRECMPIIMSSPADDWAMDAYHWEGKQLLRMTPIEEWLWADIRNANVVMYPQLPVGRFFVDFGHPKAKVAIECDGKQWHTDKQKDADRDAVLQKMGWTVYRFPGFLCREEEDEETHALSRPRRIVGYIGHRHGIRRHAPAEWKDTNDVIRDYLSGLLRIHGHEA